MSQDKITILDSFGGRPIEPQREPVEGDFIRVEVQGGGSYFSQYIPPVDDDTEVKPAIQLTNFVVKSNSEVAEPQGGIYWVGTDDKLEVTADVVDESGVLASIMSASGKDALSMVIITQEVFNGDYSSAKDSTRFKVDIANNAMALVSNKGFGLSGNYIVTKERLNLGLDNINVPFHIEMDTIEFDVLNK